VFREPVRPTVRPKAAVRSGEAAAAILAKRAELTRQLAALDERLAAAMGDAERPDQEPDRILTLAEAASHVGEPISTFRRRLVYRKALVSAPREKRLRFSLAALDEILTNRLAEIR
jgi:hypothetical protein